MYPLLWFFMFLGALVIGGLLPDPKVLFFKNCTSDLNFGIPFLQEEV